MDWKAAYQKQGGKKLLMQYLRSGTFFTAVTEFVLLGRSRTALELLRLCVQWQARRKLERRYRSVLSQFYEEFDGTLLSENSNYVWICWWQGIENAPPIVQQCYASICRHLSSRKVVLITAENVSRYVSFPDYVLQKWKSGIITDTHMSDLLRLELLGRYGGTWIDATVWCSADEKDIPYYFLNSDLFFFQCLKPGRDGHSHINCSWFITAKSNNRFILACRHLCYEYWRENDFLIDYFLLHDFMAMCLEYDHDIWNGIPPRDNATPHILLLRLFEPYNETMWKMIKDQTPFHKLSYKHPKEKFSLSGTYYRMILEDEHEEAGPLRSI